MIWQGKGDKIGLRHQKWWQDDSSDRMQQRKQNLDLHNTQLLKILCCVQRTLWGAGKRYRVSVFMRILTRRTSWTRNLSCGEYAGLVGCRYRVKWRSSTSHATMSRKYQHGKGTANDDTDKGDSCKEFPVAGRWVLRGILSEVLLMGNPHRSWSKNTDWLWGNYL